MVSFESVGTVSFLSGIPQPYL